MEHAHLADCPPLPQRKREKEAQKRKNAGREKTSTARLIAAHKGRCNRHDTLVNSF
jgi:cytochrome c biogenesis protein ResB